MTDPLNVAMESFAKAPFAPEFWNVALAASVEATGSFAAQIVNWTETAHIPGSMAHELSEETIANWFALDGASPHVNPVVRVGAQLAVGASSTDSQILDSRFRRSSDLWNQVYVTASVNHLAIGKAWAASEHQVLLIHFRNASAGNFEQLEQRNLNTLISALGNAVAIAAAIRSEGAAMLAGSLSALAFAAILLDERGKVTEVSEAAAKLMQRTNAIAICRGRMTARTQFLNAQIEMMIAAFAAHGAVCGCPESIYLADSEGEPALILRFSMLPRDLSGLMLPPAMLAILEPIQGMHALHARSGPCGLSTAEQAIAGELLEGRSYEEAAAVRHVSVETIRTQAKSLYHKLGVSGRTQLILKFGKF
jgi:DNA-binding NarL/FixJ family response regulator